MFNGKDIQVFLGEDPNVYAFLHLTDKLLYEYIGHIVVSAIFFNISFDGLKKLICKTIDDNMTYYKAYDLRNENAILKRKLSTLDKSFDAQHIELSDDLPF